VKSRNYSESKEAGQFIEEQAEYFSKNLLEAAKTQTNPDLQCFLQAICLNVGLIYQVRILMKMQELIFGKILQFSSAECYPEVP